VGYIICSYPLPPSSPTYDVFKQEAAFTAYFGRRSTLFLSNQPPTLPFCFFSLRQPFWARTRKTLGFSLPFYDRSFPLFTLTQKFPITHFLWLKTLPSAFSPSYFIAFNTLFYLLSPSDAPSLASSCSHILPKLFSFYPPSSCPLFHHHFLFLVVPMNGKHSLSILAASPLGHLELPPNVECPFPGSAMFDPTHVFFPFSTSKPHFLIRIFVSGHFNLRPPLYLLLFPWFTQFSLPPPFFDEWAYQPSGFFSFVLFARNVRDPVA